jgi:DNA-binding transcriptional ArsR family regulator
LGLKNTQSGYTDPRFGRLLWYLVCSSRGGFNRLKILELIRLNPSNANQIASQLMLDYKTVIHHLEVLTKNGLIVTDDRALYGAVYFLTPLMEKNYQFCKEIMEQSEQKIDLSQE